MTQEEAATQYELTFNTQMSQSTISELERGARRLTALEMFRFCELYEVEPYHFYPERYDAPDRLHQGMRVSA